MYDLITIIPEIDIILDDIKTEYKNTKVIKNVVTVFSKDIFKTKLQLSENKLRRGASLFYPSHKKSKLDCAFYSELL